jgi:hypothetical protein
VIVLCHFVAIQTGGLIIFMITRVVNVWFITFSLGHCYFVVMWWSMAIIVCYRMLVIIRSQLLDKVRARRATLRLALIAGIPLVIGPVAFIFFAAYGFLYYPWFLLPFINLIAHFVLLGFNLLVFWSGGSKDKPISDRTATRANSSSRSRRSSSGVHITRSQIGPFRGSNSRKPPIGMSSNAVTSDNGATKAEDQNIERESHDSEVDSDSNSIEESKKTQSNSSPTQSLSASEVSSSASASV